MEFLTNLASFSKEGGESFSEMNGQAINFTTFTNFLDPFGKIAGAIAKLLGLVK